MRVTFAPSAVLVLAGSAYGFTASQFQIQPNQSIEPSSGTFYNYYSGVWMDYSGYSRDNMPVVSAGIWSTYGSVIFQTTWLAIDRLGGGGEFSVVLPRPGPDPTKPEWDGLSTGDFGAGARKLLDGPDFITGLDAGPQGYIWGYDPIDGFEALSGVSPVNGTSKDSIFFGQFILTDPTATLVGAPLLVTIDGVDLFLPLDGSPDTNGFRIEYERFVEGFNMRTGLRAFVVVPAPATLSLLAGAALLTTRRRRRTPDH